MKTLIHIIGLSTLLLTFFTSCNNTSHKKEIDEEAYIRGYERGSSVGYDKGYEVGKEEGYQGGYKEGYDKGYKEGYDEGYDDCLKDEHYD